MWSYFPSVVYKNKRPSKKNLGNLTFSIRKKSYISDSTIIKALFCKGKAIEQLLFCVIRNLAAFVLFATARIFAGNIKIDKMAFY